MTSIDLQYESAFVRLRGRLGSNQMDVVNLYSVHQGQGHATRLMEMVIEYADKNQIILWLRPRQYGNVHGLDNQALAIFYSSFGFQWNHDISEFMIRRPQ